MNKYVRFVVTSMSLLTLFIGQGYSTNNNNETTEEYKAPLALQEQQVVVYQTVIGGLSIPTEPFTPTAIISPPLVTADHSEAQALSLVPVRNAPSVLSLRSSLQLQSSCRLFMTASAAEEMNNICTNLAYDKALALYAQHGDRFVEPFTEHIHGLIFGILESSVKKAVGLGDLFNVIKKLTGINVTGNPHVTETANRHLPQSFLNALRLKFATDLLNKHVVGPYVVAPNIAYAVNQINFGRILQEQLFVRLCNILVSFQDELVDRSVSELKQYAEQIVALNEELNRARAGLLPDISEEEKRIDAERVSTLKAEIEKLNAEARAELGWTDTFNPIRDNTPKEQEVAQKCQALAALEKDIKEKLQIKHDQLDTIQKLESEIDSLRSKGQATAQALIAAGRYNNQGQVTEHDAQQANLLLQPTCTLRELFADLPYVGTSIDRYMSPCPHIEPGYLSSLLNQENVSLVARVPRGYLRLTGVTGSIESLREDLGQEAFSRILNEIETKINITRDSLTQMSSVQLTPSQDELQELGYVAAGIRRIVAFASGSHEVLHYGHRVVTEGLTIHKPAVDHIRRIQAHAQQGIVNLNLAATPVRATYHFLSHAGQIWAVNYLSSLVIGAPITGHVYMVAFMFAMLQEFYIRLCHMV
ncbi:MAG: hypothetical protein KBB83_02625 [Alphaproteobacteria bacterium]|nr:hypothetical protein [Alphaproteobacteria bacterium]